LAFHRARVELHARDPAINGDHATCSLIVALAPTASLRIRSSDAHIYAAINHAVERLGDTLGERFDQRRAL